MKNKTYHIVYSKKVDDIYSTGVNIEAEKMLQALIKLNAEYKVEPFFISL